MKKTCEQNIYVVNCNTLEVNFDIVLVIYTNLNYDFNRLLYSK